MIFTSGHPELVSVVYRTTELPAADYDEAIQFLAEVRDQLQRDASPYYCPCGDGCSAGACHQDPLVMAREAARLRHGFWRCFHCDAVFTDEATALEHFGYDDSERVACRR